MVLREAEVFFNEQLIGYVRIGLTTAPLQQEVRSLLWLSLGIITVILAALYVSIRYFLQTSLQRPLTFVLERIQQTAQGRYMLAATSVRHHEFNTMIEQFDAMADSVRQREFSLSEANRRMSSEIADRKRAQETLQRFMDVLEATPDLVAMTDKNGRVLYINNGGRRMLGLANDDPPEKMKLGDFLPKAIRKQFFEKAVSRATNDGVWSDEALLKPRQGNTIPASLVILAHKSDSGDVDYYSTIARDISIQKQSEQALKAHRDQLEERVAERTRDLQQEILNRQQTEWKLRISQEKAESSNQAKSEFLANMSHELRTPLNGILGYANILRKPTELSEDRRREGLEVISQCGEHLLTLINDMLDLAKVEAGRLDLQPRNFALSALLIQLDSLFKSRFQEKDLDFQIHTPTDLPVAVRGDDRKLRQVLINLLGNAVKFTHTGTVFLRISQMGGKFRFEVEDSGIGIPDEFLAEIFNPFSQLDDPSMPAEGTGLGLAISYQLVQLMGGQLMAQSAINRGSRFWFDITLPQVEQLLVEPVDNNIVGFEGTAQRILIVDDKSANRAVLIGLLGPLSFVCKEACRWPGLLR